MNLGELDIRRSPAAITMSVAALAAVLVWLISGAYTWRGYPVDHGAGEVITVLLGVLTVVVFISIARLARPGCMAGAGVIWLAVICWSVARLVVSSLVPLVSDEAYHWMWAKYLDLGYYDHPGMVAWLARLFAPFHGQATALVRLSPIVQEAIMALLVYQLANMTLRDRTVAGRAALVFMLIPTFSFGLMLLIPSVAVNLFWLLSIIFLWQATRSDRWWCWVLLGLFCGAGFNSNFTTFFIPVWAFAYLLLSRADRRLLFRPGPYIALAVATVAFLPTLIWNYQNHWVTLAWNSWRRLEPTAFKPDSIGIYLGELLAFISPVLAAGMIRTALTLAGRAWREKDRPVVFLACMGLGPLLTFLMISSVQHISAHYAAPGFIPLLILFVWGCFNRRGYQRSQVPSWYVHGVRVALIETVMVSVAVLLPVFVSPDDAYKSLKRLSPRHASKRVAEVYGWSALGDYLDSFGQRIDAKSPLVVLGPSYAQTSMAMCYAENIDFAYSLDEGGRFGQQFGLWGSLEKLPLGCNAIIFHAGASLNVEGERRHFEQFFDRVEAVDPSDPRLRYFAVFRAYGYKGGLFVTGRRNRRYRPSPAGKHDR